MQTLTETIIAAGRRERLLNESQLARLLGGSAQRRYNLVNRALHHGEAIRLRRGCYRLATAIGGEDEMEVTLWPNEIFDREWPDTVACAVEVAGEIGGRL
ncbi:hypothetical protein [Thiocapsa sp.]|uniref:hypothetical protein n=1 Tax=Thiocapsa sp. TaxID=2024551 RepID=UPI003592F297